MSVQANPASPRSFLSHVLTLGTGQMIAIALPLFAAPVLGRIYTPADYGALALFMAATGVLSVVAALQMQHGIIAARTLVAAQALVWLVVLLALASAALVLVALLAATRLGATPGWLWLLPFSAVLAGVMAGVTTLANRQNRYSALARLQVATVAATVAGSIGFGVLGWGRNGLFGGYVLGQVVSFAICLRLFRAMMPATRPPSQRQLRAVGQRHRRFALFTLPGELLLSVTQQLPVFALGLLGAGAALGAFSRARRLAAMPVTLIGSATGQVFRADAAQLWHTTGSCRALYLKTAATLFLVGALPCLAFMATAPTLFTLYLGPDWREAGEIAQVLAPMLLLRLAVSPVSAVFQIAGQQRLSFGLSLIAFTLVLAGVAVPVLWDAPALTVVTGFSVAYGLVYSLYFAVGLRVSGS
jgi:O-antigen/teichoic acid export membrane protein